MLVIVESWFIPFDILQIVCTLLMIIISTFCLFLIVWDKTCHTIPMMLVADTYVAGIVSGCIIFSMGLFSFQNDRKQIQYQDSTCVFRGYLAYVSATSQNYSYLLSAIYRYLIVVYPAHVFWQSTRTQIFLIGLKWIFSFGSCFAFMFTGDIIYNVDNQICQMPLRFSFPIVYAILCFYIIPVSMIMLVYMKLVRYVHTVEKRVTPQRTFTRARKDLKMVRRIVILVHIVLFITFPYTVLLLISFFTTPPKYHFRISFIFINLSLVAVAIVLFQFTDPLKASVKRLVNR